MGINLHTLSASLHSVKISDGTNDLALDGSGYITSNINGTVTIADGGGSITVDGTVAATQSGTWDVGTLTTITNDVNIADGGNSITVDGTIAATQSGTWTVNSVPGGFATWKVTAAAPTSTESELVSTPLTSRANILIQNLGAQDVYVKEITGVSTANGILIPKGSSYEASLDEAANIFAITGSGSTDLRIAEFAA